MYGEGGSSIGCLLLSSEINQGGNRLRVSGQRGLDSGCPGVLESMSYGREGDEKSMSYGASGE